MKKTKSHWQLVLPAVLLIALGSVGCNRGHNDNVQDNGPDQLPLRLQLPKSTSQEAFRIVQYAQDNVTRKVQQSALKEGPYSGGRQLRIFDDNNVLAEIRTFYPSMPGATERLAYRATFVSGHYQSENTYNGDGSRLTEGRRLTDGTFEQSTYVSGGQNLSQHAIFGHLMSDQQKVEWKLFSNEVYRDDKTLAVSKQRMDDGHTDVKYFDGHNFLVETVSFDKSGTATTETDYRPDGKTPLVRYDFADKVIWTFDEKGVIASKRKWYYDESQQLTVYKAGVPVFIQDWELDEAKSDKKVTPAKIVLYLSWVKELRPDGNSYVRDINFYKGTKVVETIDVTEAPPQDAKFKPADGPAVGSTTVAKNWTPPPPAPKGAAAASAPATPAASPASTTPAVSPYWTPSGAHEVYSYSDKGFLLKVDTYKAGQPAIANTVTHKESARIRAKIAPSLIAPLPAATNPPDKPKDPSPTAVAQTPAYDDDF